MIRLPGEIVYSGVANAAAGLRELTDKDSVFWMPDFGPWLVCATVKHKHAHAELSNYWCLVLSASVLGWVPAASLQRERRA